MVELYSVFLAIVNFLEILLFLIYTISNRRGPQLRISHDSEAYRQMRKCFAEFIYIRLLTDILKAQKKYSEWYSNNIWDETIQTAHEEMHSAIELFRSDAKKVLVPNELEISLPPEELYGLTHEEETLLRLFHGKIMSVHIEDLVKNLFNATEATNF